MSMISETLLTPALAGGIAFLGAKAMGYDQTGMDIGVMSTRVNGATGMALTVGAGSLVAEVSKNYVLSSVPAIGNTLGMLASPAITGAAAVGVNYLMGDQSQEVYKPFILGAASQVGADYVRRSFLGL